MSFSTVLKDMMEERVKSFHVAFLAQILSVSGNRAKIQPLGLTKDYGGTATKQAPIPNVPILESAQYKISEKEIEYVSTVSLNVNKSSETIDGTTISYVSSVTPNVTKKSETVAKLTPIKKGDIVLCVCCDRNIDAAIKGENTLPPVGCHNKSDCVIVSII